MIQTDGDNQLGDENLTNVLINFVYQQLKNKHQLDMFSLDSSGLSLDKYTENKFNIRNTCEEAKSALSDYQDTKMELTGLYSASSTFISGDISLTRDEYEQLIKKYIDKSLEVVKRSLENAKLTKQEIDTIILAGGTSRTPIIEKQVEDFFGKSPQNTKDTQTVVAEGAGIFSHFKYGGSLQTKGAGTDNDEQFDHKQPVIEEYSAYDVGLALKGGKFDPIIKAGEKLNTSATEEYEFSADNQTQIKLELFQRHNSKSNTVIRIKDDGIEHLADLILTGWHPLPQKTTRVYVTLTSVPEEGIIKVKTEIKNKTTGELLFKSEQDVQAGLSE